jgi:DNA mismatch repair protein MutS
MAIAPGDARNQSTYGVALLDVSTGEFTATEYSGSGSLQTLTEELGVLRPRELIVPGDSRSPDAAAAAREVAARWPTIAATSLPITTVDAWAFDGEAARRTLVDQLHAGGLEGFGLDRHPAAVCAAGALIHYLRSTQKADLAHVRSIAYRQRADALLIDATTLKHLEILEGSEGGRQGSLLDELDRTVTSMASRLLRSWLLRPQLTLGAVQDRLDAVEELAFRTAERGKFREAIKGVQDLERLVARAALGTAGPRDLVGLKQSLAVIPRLRTVLADLQAPLVLSLTRTWIGLQRIGSWPR